MAFSVTNADASPLSPASPEGNVRTQYVRLTFDSSYPTGGLALSPAQVGLQQIVNIVTNGMTEVGKIAVPLRQANGTYLIKVFTLAAAPAIEVASTTDLSADHLVAIVWGY